MKLLNPRHNDIVGIARSEGRVDVEGLAEKFDVTPQTIRKDLNELCELGILQRFHGGAVLASGVSNVGYERRQNLSTQAKHSIGRHAASLIPDNASIFINIGTTTEEVAAALQNHQGLLVITNNLNVAQILRRNENIEVVVAGGILRHSDGGIVGDATVDFIRQFRVDYAVIGVSAIENDGSLLDYDFREVSVSRAILASSKKSILVADSMKLSRSAPVRIGHIAEIDYFVTDDIPTNSLEKVCADNKVKIEIANTDSAPSVNA
jgi:DeoR family glycerol-3-phosphate regulon repressor